MYRVCRVCCCTGFSFGDAPKETFAMSEGDPKMSAEVITDTFSVYGFLVPEDFMQSARKARYWNVWATLGFAISTSDIDLFQSGLKSPPLKDPWTPTMGCPRCTVWVRARRLIILRPAPISKTPPDWGTSRRVRNWVGIRLGRLVLQHAQFSLRERDTNPVLMKGIP